MDFLVKIDAELSLSDTQNRCEVEQAAGFQLDNVTFGTVVQDGTVIAVNKAEFDLKLTNRLNKLLFVEVGANNPANLRQQKEGEGWTFICDSRIYVQSKLTRVIVFGKKTT